MRAASLAALALGITVVSPRAQAQRLNTNDLLVAQAEAGVAYSDVAAFDNQQLIPGFTESKLWGPRVGGLLGLRFGPFSVGVRGDLARYQPYDIGTLGLNVELRVPIPVLQPYARVSGGYAWLGAVEPQRLSWMCQPGSTAMGCPRVSGWTFSAGGGLDLALHRRFTLGVGLDVWLLNLTRSADPRQVQFTQQGDAVGLQISLSLHAAFRL